MVKEDLLAQGLTDARVRKCLYTLTSIRKGIDKPFKKASSEDLKRYIGGLENSKYAEWTKHDLKVILKKYLTWLDREDLIAWMKIETVKNGTLPEEVFTEDDIKGITGAAYTVMDATQLRACRNYNVQILKNLATDERTINTFGQYYLNCAGVVTPDPGVCAAAGGV